MTSKQLLEGQFRLLYTINPRKVSLERQGFCGQNYLGYWADESKQATTKSIILNTKTRQKEQPPPEKGENLVMLRLIEIKEWQCPLTHGERSGVLPTFFSHSWSLHLTVPRHSPDFSGRLAQKAA